VDQLGLSFIFGAGVVAQTVLFIRDCPAETLLPRVGLAALVGLGGLLPGKHERDYQLHFHVCYCFVIFAFMIFGQFKKEIMARVSESSLLGNSLVFWYLCVTFFDGTAPQRTIMGLAVLPTLATLVVAFTIREWSFPIRLCCYIWFLALMLAISCFQVGFGNMSFIWSAKFSPPGPFSLFLTGMAFAYLVGSLFYIYILIPLAGKNETQEHRMITWREDAHLMASCFADFQMTAPQAFSIIVCQGGLYFLNYRFQWVSVPVALNLSLLGLPYVFNFLFGFFDSPAVVRTADVKSP
jgi:hypothetical protein